MSTSRDALLTFALGLSAVFAVSVWVHRAIAPPIAVPAVLEVGESFRGIIPATPAGTPIFLFFVDSQCKACTASEPFYRRLAAAKPFQARLVVFSLESKEFTRQQLARWQLRPDRVMIVPRANWSRRTPTLGLLDHNANVVFATQMPLRVAEYTQTTAKLRSLVFRN